MPFIIFRCHESFKSVSEYAYILVVVDYEDKSVSACNIISTVTQGEDIKAIETNFFCGSIKLHCLVVLGSSIDINFC